MICPGCGREIPDTGKFCPGCGQPVLQTAVQGGIPEKPNKSVKYLVAIMIVVVIIILVLLGLILLLQKSWDSEEKY